MTHTPTTLRRFVTNFDVVASVVAMALGLVVIIGWYLHSAALVQVLPAFAPMQYNTALGFLLCGSALLALAMKRPTVVTVLASVAAIIGFLTLIEYLFTTDLGIDQLLMEHDIVVATSSPGRMAPNTAFSFLVSGITLVFLARMRFTRVTTFVAGLGAATVIVLGFLALVGYGAAVETAYGWGSLTRMAIHTAVGFLVLGNGLFAFVRRNAGNLDAALQRQLTLGTSAVAIIALTLGLWIAIDAQEQARIDRAVQEEANRIGLQLSDRTAGYSSALAATASRWVRRGLAGREQWEDDAAEFLVAPGARAIGWIDTRNEIQWVATGTAYPEAPILREDPRRLLLMSLEAPPTDGARAHHLELLGVDGNYLGVTVPLIDRSQLSPGYLLAVIDVEATIESIPEAVLGESVAFQLSDGDTPLYALADTSALLEVERFVTERVDAFDASWTVKVWPTRIMASTLDTRIPELALVVGLIMLIVTTIALRSREALEVERATLADRVEERTRDLHRELQVARAHANEARRRDAPVLLGDSIAIKALKQSIDLYAAEEGHLLLTGPAGAGQAAVARAIHDQSQRPSHPFIMVECSRGSSGDSAVLFDTGDHTEAKSTIAIAEGGTVFLNGVDAMSADDQVALLRYLKSADDGDVRIIAYGARDLSERVQEGQFDHRVVNLLSRHQLSVPSLAERREDIPAIAMRVVQDQARALGRIVDGIAEPSMRRLEEYSWPGNIRELRNVLERAVVVGRAQLIEIDENLEGFAREVGGYHLKYRMGAGGMGDVWLAEHRLLKRPAAVKLIRRDPKEDAAAGQRLEARFRREAEVTASLRSPHTVELYDFGVTEVGEFYYVMEHLQGYDLEDLVEIDGPLPPERAIHLLRDSCLSFAEAHEAGLVHRDIKPANLFASVLGVQHDFVKVLDFGVVKILDAKQSQVTGTGLIVGTAAYIAPELATGSSQPTPQSDIYALGCAAYWLLTGRLVFEAITPVEQMRAHIDDAPTAPSALAKAPIPAALENVVLHCLEKDPANRPRTALELYDALDAVPLKRPWTSERAKAWWEEHGHRLTPSRGF